VNIAHLTRTGTAFAACAALFATVSAGASANGTTFNVSTTITNSCVLSGKGGPSDLAPAYVPSTDVSAGDESVLNTTCNGNAPTVTFTDANASGTTQFAMTSGANTLYYQISNTATCTGVAGDNPVTENVAQPLTASYDICAAVITGGLNTTVPAGSYTDTVTYTITP